MRENDWQNVKEIFWAALDRPINERAQFVAQSCGENYGLIKEVESLLASHESDSKFIETPAANPASMISTEEVASAGKTLGNYKIIREIGRGGMGAVFLGKRADGEFQQQVALKVLRQALPDAEIIRYFKREREILASLNHPFISRLLDGGVTENGLPFFVMEYIEGTSVLEFAERENLSVAERLQLFLQICAAVGFAHKNLIVHRDIKPSNILITKDGVPKLLDFGLAKIVDVNYSEFDAAQTETAFPAMTPAYASPEQMRGQPITTASDIYSLGVILYELLTDRRLYQFETHNIAEVIQIVCESEPVRPSAANSKFQTPNSKLNKNSPKAGIQNPKVLEGDLDNIVLKALRKEPERRYQSAEQFADDIERHLKGLPVKARPNTFSYRAEKFIRRNKLSAAAGLLILLTLIGGVAATLWQARRAAAQRVKAEKRFNDVRQLSHSLMFDIHDSVQNLQGSTPTRELIVSRALEYLDSLAQEASGDTSLQRELATGYEKIGDIQGNPYSANLGDTDGALGSYRKAVAIRESFRSTQKSTDTEMEIGRSYRGLGDILEAKGNNAESLANYRLSLEIFEQLAATNPNDAAVQDELARAYDTLGDGLGHTDNKEEKLQIYNKALKIRQQLLAQNPDDAKQRRSTATAFLKFGSATAQTDKAEAIEDLRRGTQILEQLSTADPNNAKARREVGYAYFLTGNVLTELNEYQAALESRLKAFEIRREIAAEDRKNQQAQFDFAVAYADIADAYINTDEPAKGFEQGQKSLEIFRELSVSDPTNAVYLRNLGYCYEKLAQAKEHIALAGQSSSMQSRQWTEARDWYQKAFDVFTNLKSQGTIKPVDAEKIEKLSAKITDCQNAAARLN